MELSTRREKILAAVVDAYVETGDPVGSKSIAAQLGVSSATVRNEWRSFPCWDCWSSPTLPQAVCLLKKGTGCMWTG